MNQKDYISKLKLDLNNLIYLQKELPVRVSEEIKAAPVKIFDDKNSPDYFSHPKILNIDKNNFNLMSKIIEGIHTPFCLKEIIEKYDDYFHYYDQYSVYKILPILKFRMDCISECYSQFEPQIRNTTKLFKGLIDRYNILKHKTNSLAHIIESSDFSTELYVSMENTQTIFKTFDNSFSPLALELMNHLVQTHDLDPSHLIEKQKIIINTKIDGDYDTEWVKKQLKVISEKLFKFRRLISWTKLRLDVINLFQNYFAVDYVIYSTTGKFFYKQNLMDNLPNFTVAMDEIKSVEVYNRDFFKQFTEFINSIYLSQDIELKLNDAIDNYNFIFNLLEETTNPD